MSPASPFDAQRFWAVEDNLEDRILEEDVRLEAGTQYMLGVYTGQEGGRQYYFAAIIEAE